MNYKFGYDPHNEIRLLIGAGSVATPTLTRTIRRKHRPPQEVTYVLNRATSGPFPETIEAIYRRIN